jgi:hypothetical protein
MRWKVATAKTTKITRAIVAALSPLSRDPMMSPRPRDSPLLDLEDVYNNNQGTGSFGGALWAISHRSF